MGFAVLFVAAAVGFVSGSGVEGLRFPVQNCRELGGKKAKGAHDLPARSQGVSLHAQLAMKLG